MWVISTVYYAIYLHFLDGFVHSATSGMCIIAERLSARHLILQHALGRCIFVRHALLSVTLLSPSRSFVRHAPLSVTLLCPSRSFVRHAPLSVTLLCPSRSFVRHALLSVTLLCPSRSFVRHAPLSVTLLCPSRSFVRSLYSNNK